MDDFDYSKLCGPGETYLPDIKPCPFCGDTRGFLSAVNEHGKCSVRCNSCAAEGPWAKSASSAMVMWERRDR